MPRLVIRVGGSLLLLEFTPVAVDDALGRVGPRDLAILRGEVLRQFCTRVIVELAARRAS